MYFDVPFVLIIPLPSIIFFIGIIILRSLVKFLFISIIFFLAILWISAMIEWCSVMKYYTISHVLLVGYSLPVIMFPVILLVLFLILISSFFTGAPIETLNFSFPFILLRWYWSLVFFPRSIKNLLTMKMFIYSIHENHNTELTDYNMSL